MKEKDRFRGCLLGLACGDAVGAAVEFMPRGSFPLVKNMVGGGPFGLPIGAFTDDHSLALCLADSLVACSKFNPYDQLNRYLRWYDEGYMSSIGRCFDIGKTTLEGLGRYRRTGEPYRNSSNPGSSGNGCIMRLAPVPMFYYKNYHLAVEYSGLSSRTTHGSVECIEACRLLGGILQRLLGSAEKEAALLLHGENRAISPGIQAIASGTYMDKTEDYIKGSGYVVESLEAALWCFWSTMDFEEAILRAVNLGDDADSTAAITGQLAGAYYGVSEIPKNWLDKLIMRDATIDFADKLYEKANG